MIKKDKESIDEHFNRIQYLFKYGTKEPILNEATYNRIVQGIDEDDAIPDDIYAEEPVAAEATPPAQPTLPILAPPTPLTPLQLPV